MMNFNLNENQLQDLCSRYRTQYGVSYFNFVADMDSAFLDHTTASPVQAAQRQMGTSRLSITQEEMVKNALIQFKQIMKVQRIMVKPVFQDFDRSNTDMSALRSLQER